MFMPRSASVRNPRRRPARLHLEALEDRAVPAAASFGQLPLAFEPNVGQASSSIDFVSHGSGYNMALSPTKAVRSLAAKSGAGDVLGMELLGGNAAAPGMGQDLQPGVSNYLIGSDPSQWHTGVANYGAALFQG